MALIEKQISNHPATGLVRTVEVAGFMTNDDLKEVNFFFRIRHSLGGVDVPVAVPRKNWKVDNGYRAIMRDGNFEPIPNPGYVPEYAVIGHTEPPIDWDEETDGQFIPQPIYGETIINEIEQWMLMPAYDYFKLITFDSEDPVRIQTLLLYYIDDNDAKDFFNFY